MSIFIFFSIKLVKLPKVLKVSNLCFYEEVREKGRALIAMLKITTGQARLCQVFVDRADQTANSLRGEERLSCFSPFILHEDGLAVSSRPKQPTRSGLARFY